MTNDRSPRICWKSISIFCALVVLLFIVAVFAHNHLTIDNHPSSQVFVPNSKH